MGALELEGACCYFYWFCLRKDASYRVIVQGTKRLSVQNPISLNMEAISIEPTGEMRMKIERLSKVRYMDTPSLIRKLIDIGIEHELKDYAIGLFRDKKVSLGKAAEISGISKRAMLDLLKERDIPLNISTRDIQKDFNAATE